MRTYIGPIGFNPTSVTRPILSHGLDHGDEVVLIRPQEDTDDRRAEETIADIRRNLGALEPDVNLHLERVPHDEFGENLLICRNIIIESSGDAILLLGGGARDVLIPLTIAGLSVPDSVSRVLRFSDIDGGVREMSLPRLLVPIQESVRGTLLSIGSEEEISLPTLTDRLDASKSTVTRHVKDLEEHDLVETWRVGRTKHLRLTLSGKLIIQHSSPHTA